jgi:hypothetical protein
MILRLSEKFDACWCEYVVIPLPRELSLHETLRGQALHSFDDLQIRDIELFMLLGVEVFLSDENAL